MSGWGAEGGGTDLFLFFIPHCDCNRAKSQLKEKKIASVARVYASGDAGMRRWLTSLKHFFREVGISPSRTCRTASMSSLAAYPPRSLAKRLKRSADRQTERQTCKVQLLAQKCRCPSGEQTGIVTPVMDEMATTSHPDSWGGGDRVKFATSCK